MKELVNHRLVAYKDDTFLDSPAARSVRILSEYLEPLDHFRDLLPRHVERRHEAHGVRLRRVKEQACLEGLCDDRRTHR